MENQIHYDFFDRKDISLGKNITFLRKERGLNQTELADALGDITKSAISSWEKGHSYPQLSTLIKLSAYFQVDLERFVFGDVSETNKGIGGDKGKMVSTSPRADLINYDNLLLTIEDLRRELNELKAQMKEIQQN